MIWFDIECVARGRYRLKIKKWHPGLWREVYRTLREGGSGRLVSLWFTVYFVVRV